MQGDCGSWAHGAGKHAAVVPETRTRGVRSGLYRAMQNWHLEYVQAEYPQNMGMAPQVHMEQLWL